MKVITVPKTEPKAELTLEERVSILESELAYLKNENKSFFNRVSKALRRLVKEF